MTSRPNDGWNKETSRSAFLEVRHEISAEMRFVANTAIVRHLEDWLQSESVRGRDVDAIIGVYSAFRDEVDLSLLWAAGSALRAQRFAFPKVQKKRQLSFFEVSPGLLSNLADDGRNRGFERNTLGILEPDETTTRALAPNEIAVVLVPGVAFAPDGVRLGYGGGYYDRWFAKSDVRAVRVGVCFQAQMAVRLPGAAHDARMHYIVTEAGIQKCP